MNNIGFVIACENYQYNSYPNLPGVKNDAELMVRALIEQCRCPVIETLGLAQEDQSPTGSSILATIVKTAQDYSDETIDNLYVYYSGHGEMGSSGNVFLLPSDAFRDGETQHGAISLDSQLLKTIKRHYNVNNIIVFLDMCLSANPTKGAKEELNTEYFPQGVAVFYSCFPYQQAFMARDGSGSFFTHCLVKALNTDGVETVSQLSAQIRKTMVQICQSEGVDQKPYTSLEDVSLNDLPVVFHNRNGLNIAALEELTAEKQEAVKNYAKGIDLTNIEQIQFYGKDEERHCVGLLSGLRSCLDENKDSLLGVSQCEAQLTYIRRRSNYFQERQDHRDSSQNSEQRERNLRHLRNVISEVHTKIKSYIPMEEINEIACARNEIAKSAREATMYILAGEVAEGCYPEQKNKLFSYRLQELRNLAGFCDSLQNPLKDCIEKSLIFQDKLSKRLLSDIKKQSESELLQTCDSLIELEPELRDLMSLHEKITNMLDSSGIKLSTKPCRR